MSCGVDHRHGSDMVLLWLWRRPAAVASNGPLAWEPPYALKKKKKKRLIIPPLGKDNKQLEFSHFAGRI